MGQEETQFAEIIKFFSLALKQHRLYSPTHPAARFAFRNLFGALEAALGAGSLTLGFVEGQILANEQPFDKKQTGVADLLNEFQRLNIESLIFDPGVTEEELAALLRIMTLPPRTLAETGGLKPEFDKEFLQRIRLGISRYRMIKEEGDALRKAELEAASGEAEAEDGSGARRRVERMDEIIEHGLTGAEDGIDFDVERLSYEVERRPESVARQMVSRADNLESLERIVQNMGSFLRQCLAQPFLQQGKDFSLTVSRLAKEFKKVVESCDTPEDFRGSIKELVSVLQQCADAVKVELIVRAFEQSGGDCRALVQIKSKFLSGRQAPARLLEPLKERLLSLGLEKDEIEQILAAEQRRPPRGAHTVEVDADELAELRKMTARYEQDVKGLKDDLARTRGHKERLENIIGSLAEGLVVVDNEGRIQMMNPAAEKLLRMTQAEGLGNQIGESLKAEHIVALTKGPLLVESEEVNKEIDLQAMDDEARKILQASSAVIENEVGQTVGMVAVLSDITKQRKLDEMKSKFVAHVSHEMRTPLLAIEQSLHILLSKEIEAVTPAREQFLGIAYRNISRLSRLINDLLDVAKIEAHEMKLKPIMFNINDLVHHVAETVGGWAESKKIVVEEKMPATEITVEADPDRLIQVITNLVGNAIKFTPEGGRITLEIDPDYSEPQISPEPCIVIAVRDTGVGIAPEDQERIFQKFEQADLAPPAQGVGSTGLGLTIAKEIVELHKGRIWVESKPAEGSRFAFVIPRRLHDRSATATAAPQQGSAPLPHGHVP
jgi:PAS domain S-box-containing protein